MLTYNADVFLFGCFSLSVEIMQSVLSSVLPPVVAYALYTYLGI